MIEVIKDPSADSRTATEPVNCPQLYRATCRHILDVFHAMHMFSTKVLDAGREHDWTKRAYSEEFYEDFSTLEPGDDFKNGKWYTLHISRERHHLMSKAPYDVNLIDVLEYISDCVMAGLSRSGDVYDITLPDELLQKAMVNTVTLLKNNVKLVEGTEQSGEYV